MRRLQTVLICGFLGLSIPSAHAAYKASGCGLGALLLPDDGFVQVFAVTTNMIVPIQAFAITSGTSGCTVAGGPARAELNRRIFVEANAPELEADMARGEGESLSTLAYLMDCDPSGAVVLKSTVQASFSRLSPALTSGRDFLQRLRAEVASESAIIKGCGAAVL